MRPRKRFPSLRSPVMSALPPPAMKRDPERLLAVLGLSTLRFHISFVPEGTRELFELPGVRSMSADLHKYGYCAKGASTVFFRSKALMDFMIFDFKDWPGGRMVTPTLAGTRPGDILIFHINGRGWHTAEALPRMIEGLSAAGYRFVLLRDYLKSAARG